MQPWSYEIFKLIMVEDSENGSNGDDIPYDKKAVKKEAVPITTDSSLTNFNGDTYDV